MKNEANTAMSIYPLVIVADRYTGVYSGGRYTAWNMWVSEIPEAIDMDDSTCREFWDTFKNSYPVGVGNTPQEALDNLAEVLKRRENEQQQEL